MKISKLHIDQFRHLENLEFDFTYQSGERKGEPLDKICFIGQSATGKTGLLEFIYEKIAYILSLELINDNSLLAWKDSIQNNNNEIVVLFENDVLKLKNQDVFFRNRSYKEEEFNNDGKITSLIPLQYKKDPVYFKANLISDKSINFLSTNPIDIIEKHNNDIQYVKDQFKNKENYGLIFSENVDTEIWLHLLSDILNYRKNFTQKMSELIHTGIITDAKKLVSEFNKWKEKNPNVLESFAKEFNYILEHLNLEVDLVNTEYLVPIKNKRIDETIPFEDTSTGTKQLLLTSLPLYSLNTQDSIIIIDEPERSLYPNIQMDLIDYYKNLAPEAQFIVATHSPFIAASFEPEERFILYFDEEGKVAFRRGSSPIGDDPNDMLYNDFRINYINKYGQQKHQEYLDLKQKIHFEKDPKKKEEISEQLEKLGEEYNF